jgi:flagellar biosynthetic protein FliS
MNPQSALIGRFRSTATETAPPERLLTMLYDRLVLDLDRGHTALVSDDRPQAGAHLTHAQDIVHELRCSLDPTAWDGAPGLLSLYDYLYSHLVSANVTRNADMVLECRDLVAPLRDAWHEAAQEVATQQTRPASSAGDLGVA